MTQIIPAILATSEDQFKKDLRKIESAEVLQGDWLHIDLADGKFVPNKTVGIEILKNNPTNLQLEVHLMVEDPNNWVDPLKNLGAKRIIAHIECGSKIIDDFIKKCQDATIKIGLAIKLETPLESLKPFLGKTALILVMSIEPGFQGLPFKQEALEKIKETSKLILGRNIKIGVDGHVDSEDAKVIIDSGADILVSGSYLLKGDIDENLEEIWEATHTED